MGKIGINFLQIFIRNEAKTQETRCKFDLFNSPLATQINVVALCQNSMVMVDVYGLQPPCMLAAI